MNTIHIVDGLLLTTSGELKSSGPGKPGQVFLRQGDLDGACAIYSMMMCLILRKKITYNKLKGKQKGSGFTGLRRLQKEFLDGKYGLYRDGFFFDRLSELLQHVFSKYVTSQAYSTISRTDAISKQELHEILLEELKAGRCVEIGFTRKGNSTGHAVVAIGYQEFPKSIRLFCLDPGYSLHEQSYWNTIIDINTDYYNQNTKYSDINLNSRETLTVNVDEIMVFE